MKKFKFYDIRDMIKQYPDAHYYICFGERSNGKTYSILDLSLEKYRLTKTEQFAYIRRFGEDIKPKQMSELFSAHRENGRIADLFDDEWDRIIFQRGKFYLARFDEDSQSIEHEEDPIGFAFDLAGMEHYKSISFPNVTTVIFDEFLSRKGYLPNEFELFQNTLSTIIRQRDNVKIFMLGNTVNQYCPYFKEMGLNHVKEQKQGSIDLYTYAGTNLQVAVEYCESTLKRGGKASNVYFSFDNPKLQMIVGGAWEINVYPRLPFKYAPKDVLITFFIEFDREVLHCEILSCPTDGSLVLFIHPKTTPIKRVEDDVVYCDYPVPRWNYRMQMTHHSDRLTKLILQLIKENRVYYATNEAGEILRNYILWCNSYSVKS